VRGGRFPSSPPNEVTNMSMKCEACGGDLFYTRSAKIEVHRIYEAGYKDDKVHICDKCLKIIVHILKLRD